MNAPPALHPDDVIPIHVADVRFPESHPLSGQQGAVFAFAVHHRAGVILFETGIGGDSATIERLYQPVRRSLLEALAEHGIHHDDIGAIVNSHLHFDHCGGNPLFPEVPIYAQEAEYAAAHSRGYTIREWVDFEGARYKLRQGDYEVVPGIEVLATTGHSPGHQSLAVATDTGPVLLAGQAIYSRAEYEYIRDHGTLPPGPAEDDPLAYLASARRLLGFQPQRVLFSHDGEVWEANASQPPLPRSP